MDLTCPERERYANAAGRRTADGGAELYRSELRYLDRMHWETGEHC